MASHVADESFVLIEQGKLQEVAFPPLSMGTTVSIKARGLADDDAQPVARVVTGEAMRPPSPVDLNAVIGSEGELLLDWTRRSKLSWTWPDGSEVPLGESMERYRIDVQGSAGSWTFLASEPRLTISRGELVGATGMLTISVVQIGDFAESRPVTTLVEIAA